MTVGFIVIATSFVLIAQASTGFVKRSEREKTALDLQIESARDIRAALAKPIRTPPLPPITARPLHDVRSAAAEHLKSRSRVSPTAPGMDAMAMETSDPQMAYAPAPDRYRPQ